MPLSQVPWLRNPSLSFLTEGLFSLSSPMLADRNLCLGKTSDFQAGDTVTCCSASHCEECYGADVGQLSFLLVTGHSAP